jgi:hypothetical protein
MDNLYIIALTVSIVYIIFKLFELKFILKKDIKIKQLIIDGILVYFSVILSVFIIEQFIYNTKDFTEPPVFTSQPAF